MESELERLRREIAEMEAKLHGHASSTKSGSTRDGNDHSSLVHHVKKETEPQLSADSSSLDEDEEFSSMGVAFALSLEKSILYAQWF